MSDLEEVSDNELMDKMTDSPELSMKLSKKKKEEDEDDDESVKSESETEETIEKDIVEDEPDVDVEDEPEVEVEDEDEPEDDVEPDAEDTEPVIEGETTVKPKNTKLSFKITGVILISFSFFLI